MHSAGCELCQTGRRPAERLSRMFEDIRLTQCRKQRHAERIHHHGFADSRSHQAEQIHSQVSAIKADRSEGNGVETQALQQQRKIRGHDEASTGPKRAMPGREANLRHHSAPTSVAAEPNTTSSRPRAPVPEMTILARLATMQPIVKPGTAAGVNTASTTRASEILNWTGPQASPCKSTRAASVQAAYTAPIMPAWAT